MPITDANLTDERLRELAAALDEVPPGGSATPVLVPASAGRRVLAFVVDAAVLTVVAPVLTVMALLVYMVFTGDDFDGPPVANVAGEWFGRTCLTFFALLWSSADVWAATSVGKVALGLRIVSDTGEARTPQLLMRWGVKWLPVIVLLVISGTAFAGIQMNRNDFVLERTGAFHEAMRWLAVRVPVGGAVAWVLYYVINRWKPLHDRVAGTGVMMQSRQTHVRAFTPVMGVGEKSV